MFLFFNQDWITAFPMTKWEVARPNDCYLALSKTIILFSKILGSICCLNHFSNLFMVMSAVFLSQDRHERTFLKPLWVRLLKTKWKCLQKSIFCTFCCFACPLIRYAVTYIYPCLVDINIFLINTLDIYVS